MAIDPTEPAYPQHGWTKDPEVLSRMKDGCMGMTKREEFASRLMAAYLMSPKFVFEELDQYALKACHAANSLIRELNYMDLSEAVKPVELIEPPMPVKTQSQDTNDDIPF